MGKTYRRIFNVNKLASSKDEKVNYACLKYEFLNDKENRFNGKTKRKQKFRNNTNMLNPKKN